MRRMLPGTSAGVFLLFGFLAAQPAEYRVEAGQGIVRQIIHLPGKPHAAAVSAEREWLAIGVSSTLLPINFADRSLEKTIEFDKGNIFGAAFLQDKQTVAVAGVDEVSVLEASSGKRLLQIPDKRQLVTISEDESNLRFWSADNGAAGAVIDTKIERPQRLVISPDHSMLAVSGSGGVVALFRLPDLQEAWRNSDFGVNPVLAFSPDNRFLAVGDDGGGADVVNLNPRDGTEATSRYVGSSRVGGIGWTADGGIITAPSGMGFGIYFYPLKEENEGAQVLDQKFLAEEDVDNAVAISSKHHSVAVIGQNQTVRIYRLSD